MPMRLSRVWLDGLSLLVGILMLIYAALSLAEMRRDELLTPLMTAGFFVLFVKVQKVGASLEPFVVALLFHPPQATTSSHSSYPPT